MKCAGNEHKGCSTRIRKSQEILSLADFHSDLGVAFYGAEGEFDNKVIGKDKFFAL